MRSVNSFFVSLTLILSFISSVNGLPVLTKPSSAAEGKNESIDRPVESRTLYRRAGMKHRDELTNPSGGPNPVPKHYYYPTQNGVYSGADVNSAADKLLDDVAKAPEYRARGRGGYPRVSTGFGRNSLNNPLGSAHRENDRANDPNHISYHNPIGNTPGGSPGPDRLVAIRPNKADSKYNLGISFHDSRKPLGNGGNHPFSQSKPWTTGSETVNRIGANVQSKVMKAQGTVNDAARKVAGGAKAASNSVVSGAKKVGGSAVSGAKSVVSGAKKVSGGVVSGAKKVSGGVVSGAKKVSGGVVSGAKKVSGGVVSGAKKVGGGVVSGAKKVGGGVVSGAKKVGGGVVSGAKKVGGGIASGAKAVGSAVGKAGGAIKGMFKKKTA